MKEAVAVLTLHLFIMTMFRVLSAMSSLYRSAVLMIPAWHHCPSGWTKEYMGYLMTQHYTHTKATYECVNINAESIPGSSAQTDGGLFHHVEATCNGILCPPYDPQKELTCAVCTK